MLLLALLLRPGAAWAQEMVDGSGDGIEWQLPAAQLNIAPTGDRHILQFCTATATDPEQTAAIKYDLLRSGLKNITIDADTEFPAAECEAKTCEVVAYFNMQVASNSHAHMTFTLSPKPPAQLTWALEDAELDVWGGSKPTAQLEKISVTPEGAKQYLMYGRSSDADRNYSRFATTLTFPAATGEVQNHAVCVFVRTPDSPQAWCPTERLCKDFRVRAKLQPTITWDVSEEQRTLTPLDPFAQLMTAQVNCPGPLDDEHTQAYDDKLNILYYGQIDGGSRAQWTTNKQIPQAKDDADTQVTITAEIKADKWHQAASTQVEFTIPQKPEYQIKWELNEAQLTVAPLTSYTDSPDLFCAKVLDANGEEIANATPTYRQRGSNSNINRYWQFPAGTNEEQTVSIYVFMPKNATYRQTTGPEYTFTVTPLGKPVIKWPIPDEVTLNGGESFSTYADEAKAVPETTVGFKSSTGTTYSKAKTFPMPLDGQDQEITIQAYTVANKSAAAADPVFKKFIVPRKATPVISWPLTLQQQIVQGESFISPLLTATVQPASLDLTYRFANNYTPVKDSYQFPAARDECQNIVVEVYAKGDAYNAAATKRLAFHVVGKNHHDGDFTALTLPEAPKAINDDPNAPCYDLLGRRLAQPPAKGLYIQNHRLKQAHKR